MPLRFDWLVELAGAGALESDMHLGSPNFLQNRLGRRALAFACTAIAVIAGVLALADSTPVLADSGECPVTDLGTLGGETQQLKTTGRWTTEDCDSAFRPGSDAHSYRFQMTEPGRVRIDLLSSEADSYLYLLSDTGERITDDDDGAAGRDARIERDLEPGAYRIEATTVGGRGRGPADFSLSASYVEGCETIHLGALTAEADLTATGFWTLETCGSRIVETHPAYNYSFMLPASGRVRIELTSKNGDPVLSLTSPTAGVIGANDDGADGIGSRIEEYLPAGVYLIEATTYRQRDLQPLVADFELTVHLVDEVAAQNSFILKVEETLAPDVVIAGEPFAVDYRVGNVGGSGLPEGSFVLMYTVGPRVFESLAPIPTSELHWQAGVGYHSSSELASATSTAIPFIRPMEITLPRPGPAWVFVAAAAFQQVEGEGRFDNEISFHGIWRNLTVLSGPTLGPVTVSVGGADYEVEATAGDEGEVTNSVTSPADPLAEVDETVQAKAIYAAAVHEFLLKGIFERAGLEGLTASGEPLEIALANAASDTLSSAFADQYIDVVGTSGLPETLAAGEAVNPVAVENLTLEAATRALRQYTWLSAVWSDLEERTARGGTLSLVEAVALHSELAYAERILAPLVAAGKAVAAAREAEAGWQDAAVRAVVNTLAGQANCESQPYLLNTSFLAAEVQDVEGLLALDAELRAALPVFGFGSDAALCAASAVDGENARFVHRLGVLSNPEVASLHARPPAPPPAAQPQPSYELRVIARLTEDGRVEHGVEFSNGVQVLPEQRFLGPDARTGIWYITSDVEDGGSSFGLVRARRLADGRTELGFRGVNAVNFAPSIRFLPTELPVGVWLRSSAIEVPPPPRGEEETSE